MDQEPRPHMPRPPGRPHRGADEQEKDLLRSNSRPPPIPPLQLDDDSPNSGVETPERPPESDAECLICDSHHPGRKFEQLPLCESCAQACEGILEGTYRYFEEQNTPLSTEMRKEFKRQFAKEVMDIALHGPECPCPKCKHRRALVWTQPEAAAGIRKYSQQALNQRS